MKANTLKFTAEVYSVGINRCVDVPFEISQALGEAKYIPVKGTIGELPFRSTLTPRGEGLYRLFIHSSIWKRLGVDKGDKIEVYLEPDTAPGEPDIPDDVWQSLLNNDEAREIFENMTTRLRNSYITYINDAKTPETREKRLAVGIERLLERKSKPRKK